MTGVQTCALISHSHRFDLPGVFLWALAMFCIVFGIQEGESYDWGVIWGPVSVPTLIVGGIVVLAAFLWWQRAGQGEPLLPLGLFRDRNFSLANSAIAMVGVAVTSNSLPLVFYYQLVLGFTPTRAALQLVPMALFSGGLAPLVGRLVDRVHTRYLATAGMLVMASAMTWYAVWLVPDESLWWRLLLPSGLMGIGTAFTFSPISATATYNLAPANAGAGSGVYNSVRQVGAVLGSAAISALMQARLAVTLPGGAGAGNRAEAAGRLPEALRAGFTSAMATSMLLPASAALVGAALCAFFVARAGNRSWTAGTPME